jgi:hypothetical protein
VFSVKSPWQQYLPSRFQMFGLNGGNRDGRDIVVFSCDLKMENFDHNQSTLVFRVTHTHILHIKRIQRGTYQYEI